MASKIVIFALVGVICEVQSQPIGFSNSQSSPNAQSSCGCGPSQSQTIQFQPSNANKGLKASPQLKLVPGQNCNLQAIPLSQLLQQGSNLQRPQTGCTAPRQNLQVTSLPKIPSSPSPCIQQTPCVQQAPCVQPTPCAQPTPCNPTIISSPVSTITIPPSGVTTVIDNSLSNRLASALQLLIAREFLTSASCNNIINQDCTQTLPYDLSEFVKSLNANQLQDCQYQTSQRSCLSDEFSNSCDWEKLLERLQENQCGAAQTCKDSDWTAIVSYLNAQNDKNCDKVYSVEIEPECSNYDYSAYNYLKQGQIGAQTSQAVPVQSCCDQVQNYNQQGVYKTSQNADIDRCILEILATYLGCKTSEGCTNNYQNQDVAELIFPEEIPAQLVCNYGYMPTTVPVVSFSVQPVGDPNCNIVVGSQCQC